MANQNNSTQRTAQEKCDYYKRRVNDQKLTDGQRKYAQKRLNQLCGGKSPSNSSKPSSGSNYTAEQSAAYTAGRVYGMAKSGKRVPVKKENQASFRKGVERERGKRNRAMY